MKPFVNKIIWSYAFLLIGLAYFFGLFVDITGDAGLYAAISRQMVESADWFNLSINNELYLQKPHLFFWLSAFGIKLFGNTNFAFKIFPFLFGLSGVYFTYRLGKDLFSKETGKLAALIAGTSQLFFLYFLDIHTDTILQTGVVLALWQLAVYLKNRKILNFIFGFVGIGIAMLSKGPVGAILPFFMVLIFVIAKKDFGQLVNLKWFLGILIVLIIISPTLIYLFKNFGIEGLKFYFISNNLGRITGEVAGSSTDPFYYIETLLWAFLPWLVFVIAALIYEIKSWFYKSNLWRVSILGSVLILLFILSAAKGKAPNYFLITVAPISVITANWLNRVSHFSIKTQKTIFRFQTIFIVIFGLIVVSIIGFFTENKIWLFYSLFLFILVAFILFGQFQSNKQKQLILASLLIIGSLNLVLNLELVPKLFKFQGTRQALEIYEKNRNANDILLNLHLEEYELFYYAKSPLVQFTIWEDFYIQFDKPGTWIYTNKPGYDGIVDMNKKLEKVYVIKQRGMNELSFQFLNPLTRQSALNENYLIKVR